MPKTLRSSGVALRSCIVGALQTQNIFLIDISADGNYGREGLTMALSVTVADSLFHHIAGQRPLSMTSNFSEPSVI